MSCTFRCLCGREWSESPANCLLSWCRAGAAGISAYDSLCTKRVQILNEYSKKLASLAERQGLSALPYLNVGGGLEGGAEYKQVPLQLSSIVSRRSLSLLIPHGNDLQASEPGR